MYENIDEPDHLYVYNTQSNIKNDILYVYFVSLPCPFKI